MIKLPKTYLRYFDKLFSYFDSFNLSGEWKPFNYEGYKHDNYIGIFRARK